MRSHANRIADLVPSSAELSRRLKRGADGGCTDVVIFEPINSQVIIGLSLSQPFILS